MSNLSGLRLFQLVARFMLGDGAFMNANQIADRYPRVFKLTGTTPTLDVRNPTYELTTTGNTTVTFTGWPASGVMAKALIVVTAGGAHTFVLSAGAGTLLTPGGVALTAPASGETNTYQVWSFDGGVTIYAEQKSAWA